jgi:hypothetical protein
MKLRNSPAAALRLGVALIVLAVAVAGCGSSTPPNVKSTQRGMKADIGGVIEEKEFKEIDVTFPSYPQDADLLEFKTRRNSANRFFIDRNSVSIGTDRVVRYSVVVKSPSGAVNTSYEAMRCKTSEYKIYAFGDNSGDWAKVPDVKWRHIPTANWDFRYALYRDYYCDLEAIAGRNEKDLIANLKGNPLNNVTDKNR